MRSREAHSSLTGGRRETCYMLTLNPEPFWGADMRTSTPTACMSSHMQPLAMQSNTSSAPEETERASEHTGKQNPQPVALWAVAASRPCVTHLQRALLQPAGRCSRPGALFPHLSPHAAQIQLAPKKARENQIFINKREDVGGGSTVRFVGSDSSGDFGDGRGGEGAKRVTGGRSAGFDL